MGWNDSKGGQGRELRMHFIEVLQIIFVRPTDGGTDLREGEEGRREGCRRGWERVGGVEETEKQGYMLKYSQCSQDTVTVPPSAYRMMSLCVSLNGGKSCLFPIADSSPDLAAPSMCEGEGLAASTCWVASIRLAVASAKPSDY